MAEEQSREAARQHKEDLEAMERATDQQAEQAARQEELLERQREAIEEAAFAAEMAAAEAGEQHRKTTANAWKLQSEAKSERAYSLYQSGMFEEAYRLAVQSIEQDPGNLDGFWVAASSLLSLHRPDEARPYLEKQIQVLNLSEYRNSSEYFVQVLELLSTQNDLFLLGNAFSETLRKNISYWRASDGQAGKLTDLFIQLELLVDAASVLDFRLQIDPRSQGTLHTALILLKKLISRGDRGTATNIVDALGRKSQSLITESYLCEMYILLGRDGKARISALVQKGKMESRRALEADVAQIKQISERGELSQETVDCVMHALREKYSEWKSAIETQIREEAVASAKSVQVKTRGGWCGILSFVVLTIAAVGYCLSHGFQPESTGPYFPFGVLFGAILIGTLYGRYMKRLRIAQETGRRLAAAFNGENKRLAELELPTLTPPSHGTGGHTFGLAIYAGVVTLYIAGWFSLMTSQGKPLTTISPNNTLLASKDTETFIDELANASAGNTYGITWTNGVGNHGAVFTASNASRIEYPGKIPQEGTVELWIKVDSGYQYQNYAFTANLDTAMVFSTDAEGGDVTWPGTTKFFVSRNGNVSLFVAKNKYNNPSTSPLEASGTPFRFGEWHAIGFSAGNHGQFIMVDGKVVAASRARTEQIGCAGNHQVPADIPTLGETASHFWPRHRYEGGFEGIVAKFRASPKQLDWHLAQGIGD